MVITVAFNKKRVIFDSLLDQRYHSYLNGFEWKCRREELKFKAQGRCESCLSFIGNRGQAHHISYENLFNENDSDLQYLCRDCHRRKHKWYIQ